MVSRARRHFVICRRSKHGKSRHRHPRLRQRSSRSSIARRIRSRRCSRRCCRGTTARERALENEPARHQSSRGGPAKRVRTPDRRSALLRISGAGARPVSPSVTGCSWWDGPRLRGGARRNGRSTGTAHPGRRGASAISRTPRNQSGVDEPRHIVKGSGAHHRSAGSRDVGRQRAGASTMRRATRTPSSSTRGSSHGHVTASSRTSCSISQVRAQRSAGTIVDSMVREVRDQVGNGA